MDQYASCQKILCVDGKHNIATPEWDVIEIPRRYPLLCMADVWEAALAAAEFETMLYLESDRILPTNYLTSASLVPPMTFAYSELLVRPLRACTLDEVFQFQDGTFTHVPVVPDWRLSCPLDKSELWPAKCPFSGNVAFQKQTYLSTPGMDPTFIGPGFVDIDLFITTTEVGCRFITLPGVETHLYHTYNMSEYAFHRINVWNRIKMMKKWSLPITPELLGHCDTYDIPVNAVKADKPYPCTLHA